MSLGSKIQANHAGTSLSNVDFPMIYIADFTERTKLLPIKRHVEITPSQQADPNDATGATLMDSLMVHNVNGFSVEILLLDDNVFTNVVTGRAHPNQHCEGCFAINAASSPKWVAFMELKDCADGSPFLAKHALKAKRQIYNVIQDLRARKIITTEKLFGIISWPQVKVSFNDMIIGADMYAATRYKRFTGVTFYGTNEAFIISEELIRPNIV